MSVCKINGLELFYLLEGEGPEVIVILNGIMMSSQSWNAHVPQLLEQGYRVLRVDFRDQGQSEKARESYAIGQHVQDLEALFAALGLNKVHLVGISYGGQVALLYALAHGERLASLMVFNTTARLTNYLKGIGAAWDEAARLRDGERFFRLAMPFIYSDVFYQSNYQWLKEREQTLGKILGPEWFEGYLRLSGSHGDYDILERLREIRVPTLVVGSDRDMVTPLEEMRLIVQGIPGARFVVIPDSGHASCYEKPQEFLLQILGFVALNKS
jgi:pimeloyl-ACP methyl ester carboxylesterase